MTSSQIAIMATIILYLCFVIVTGIMIGRRSKKSAEGFYLGGRGMGPLVTAMSAEASEMSSWLLMGLPGLAYLSGVADAGWTVSEHYNFAKQNWTSPFQHKSAKYVHPYLHVFSPWKSPWITGRNH